MTCDAIDKYAEGLCSLGMDIWEHPEVGVAAGLGIKAAFEKAGKPLGKVGKSIYSLEGGETFCWID